MALVKIGNLKGPQGIRGPQGLPGTNAVPTDAAVGAYVGDDGSATGIATQARIDASISPGVDALLANNSTQLGALQLESYWRANMAGTPRTPSNIWYGHMLNPRWKTAVERVVTGTGFAKILCIGDSTTYGSSASMPNGYMNQNSWPNEWRSTLTGTLRHQSMGLLFRRLMVRQCRSGL